ncbi:MAG: transglycosylase, partial [Rhizobiales bacterium 32-66-8]
GWAEDPAAAAFGPFLASCGALAQTPAEVGPTSNATLVPGLRQACRAAQAVTRALDGRPPSDPVARLFFAANFRAYRIVPQTQPPGFLTGYYEVEVDGSPVKTEAFPVPVYARPPDLIPTAPPSDSNRGGAQRRVGDALVPYHDRAAIEDGALAGQGLEIVYLAHPVDLFFMQIQGSGRIRLTDGRVLRLNYDGHNGYPYLPVGRLLIQRGLVPRAEMSMDRIRAFIEGDPAAGRALMRENRSFVFFKAVDLPADAGPLGAQGVPLTTDRSIAIDRHIHAYGTPFFLAADLPLNGAGAPDVPLRRLMIAQDTGSAIVGPARADLYFGAGPVAGSISGGIRHPGTFTLLVPRFSPAPGARP